MSQKSLLMTLKNLPKRLVRTHPGLYRYTAVRIVLGASRMARDCAALFDSASEVSGRAYCVDSSKTPFRFRAVYELEPAKTLAIVLARDYRAVTYSKMKRGQSLEASVTGWRNRMMQIDDLTNDLPANRVYRLKYESLCENPVAELSRFCEFLNLKFCESMLQRPIDNLHHIGGSPSKFDTSRISISLDRSYETQFEPATLAKLRSLAGEVAERWGY